MDYTIVKWIHILSSTLLFGTGLGTAFYMVCANTTRDPHIIAVVARYVVLADWLFTTPTVIIQPVSGVYLAMLAGMSLTSPWLMWSIALYIIAGACWLPVVWLQMRMRDMALEADLAGQPLTPLYWRYAGIWILLGIPAFFALVVVFYLMVAKPD